MASKSQDLNEDVQICNLIKWLDDKYNTKLTEAFPSDFEEWFEMTGQLILTMYTYYLVDKSIIGKCLSYRLTENSQSTLMLGNIIKNVDNFFRINVKPLRNATQIPGLDKILGLTKPDSPSNPISELLAQQMFIMKEGVVEAKGGLQNLEIGSTRSRDADPSSEQQARANDMGKRRRLMKGGALTETRKKALANIIIALGTALAGAAMLKMGGVKWMTGKLVGLLSPAFQDNAHCLSVWGYYKNTIGSTMRLSKSCHEIASENASAADWVVTKVQVAMTAIGFSAAGGMYGSWTMMQNFVIKFVIDPIDNGVDYLKASPQADESQSIVSKVISAEVGISAMKAYSAADAAMRTLLLAEAGKTGDDREQLFFNKNIQPAIDADDISLLGDRRDPLDVVLLQQQHPVGATPLDDVYRKVYFEAVIAAANQSAQALVRKAEEALRAAQSAVAATSAASTTPAAPTTAAATTTAAPTTAAATTTAAPTPAAATTGGKKKRKTMKKKKHHKKHARKTGKKKKHKKKKHKKKGRKTAKKHHKKHNKKHNKKHGRKTRKH